MPRPRPTAIPRWSIVKFTFRQLSYFIAAGETGGITLASKRANISQPAISTAISRIERELLISETYIPGMAAAIDTRGRNPR